MNQRTHAWIAVRAIALLADQQQNTNMMKMMSSHAAGAAIGAWIPDKTDAKRGGGQTQHHVMKNMPYAGGDKGRFIATRKTLLDRLAGSPAVKALLAADESLDSAWWSSPYKADPGPGEHIANRAMAIGTMLRDLLLIGDHEVDDYVPGAVSFLKLLEKDACTRCAQASLYQAMLSHFVADAAMPCHCDGRRIMGYDNGLHKELEAHWSRLIGPAFDEKNLAPKSGTPPSNEEILFAARAVDAKVGLQLNEPLPEIPAGRDLWLETVDMTRASFAVAALIAPAAAYPYEGAADRVDFEELFAGREDFLAEVDRAVLHDAVVNTAMAWTHVWEKVSGD